MISIIKNRKIQLSVMVLLGSFVVAGCSGSSSGSASAVGADTGGTPGASSQNVQNQIDTDSNGVDTSLMGDDPDGSQVATIPVTFNITVPKYSSNALQVRLQWADMDVNASWVTDESWSVSTDLPVNTERQLVVTFNDDNGAITLGRYEAALKTNNSGEQLVTVNANQFNTELLDSDGDGVSDLDEVLQGTNPIGDDPALAVQLSYELVPAKNIRLSWSESAAADYYRVLVNPDGVSGYEQVGGDISAPAQSFDHRAALFEMVNASYIVQACNGAGCVDSNPLMVSGTLAKAVGYFKASNAQFDDRFGSDISISQDGLTLAVAAVAEKSTATGINADHDVGQRHDAGAAYVFAYVDNTWVQQAYIKPSHVWSGHEFGSAIGLSGDGNTLVVGARHESLGGKGVNPEPEGRIYESGAAFVFVRKNGNWEQEAYIKASNPDRIDYYGGSVAISGDGNTFAIGAHRGSGIASGVNGDQSIESTKAYGAVYVYERSGGSWRQHAYVKASNPDHGDFFGHALSMSADGKTLAVGAMAEESSATGINGDQSDNSLSDFYDFGSGAVYLFRRTDESWYQQAYIKSSNGEEGDKFGSAVDLSAQGNVLVVGAYDEDSAAVGVDGDQADNSAEDAGAAYVFDFANGSWSQTAYLKASNAEEADTFGYDVSISNDGQTLVIGAKHEDSAARGINDRQDSETDFWAGAAYVFSKQSGTWQQKAYVKASNTDRYGYFGSRVSLSGDGQTLAVGSYGERSAATSINGDQQDNSFRDIGAVYLY